MGPLKRQNLKYEVLQQTYQIYEYWWATIRKR